MNAGCIMTDFLVSRDSVGKPKEWLKTAFFVLNDTKHGTILFDTGSPYESKRSLELLDTRFGIRPEDVRWVFFTHLHPDHTGLMHQLPNATFVGSAKEFALFDEVAIYLKQGGQMVDILRKLSPNYHKRFEGIESDPMLQEYVLDFWDDKNFHIKRLAIEECKGRIPEFITPISTHGHFVDCHSYHLKRAHHEFMVTGDALSSRMAFREDIDSQNGEMQLFPEAYVQSKRSLLQFEGIIIPGHDRPFFTDTLESLRKNCFDIDAKLRD